MSRVLLVEDERTQLELRTLILEHAGHEVRPVASATEAIKHWQGCQVFVIDLVSGVEQLLDLLPPEAAVIVLSGRESPPEHIRADRFLRKPCSSAVLLDVIERLTNHGHPG